MSVAIKIENLSKQYRLGLVSTRTLSHDLNRWWTMNIQGKDDPYLKIGEGSKELGSQGARERESEGIRSFASSHHGDKNGSDYIWALRDINLEIHQGEVLGIIGKNGAGKSTLLKILSKVTTPTTGTIKANGRIASLLEVGTGFHPEMTGRENIYMNGAIMGMTKAEINRKLDEIIDFAGVEQFIDTPVKRYSSGMTVRLGFAVAANLEPEILVVDEVLAVGDAEFQKKAIGKMQDISKGEGRTVLFVSHNMAAVRNLCLNGILLKNGEIQFSGAVDNVVDFYLNETRLYGLKQFINPDTHHRRGIKPNRIEILETGFLQARKDNEFSTNEPINLYIKAIGLIGTNKFRVAGSIYTNEDNRIGLFFAKEQYQISENELLNITFTIPNHNLSFGQYYLSLSVGSGDHLTGNQEYDIIHEALHFEVRSEQHHQKSNILKWEKNWGSILFPVTSSAFTA